MGARSAQSGQTNGTVTTTRPRATEPDLPHAVERKAGDSPAWSTSQPGWSALCALIGHLDGTRARRGP